MHRDDFSPSQRRHVLQAQRGYLAFLPPPLPHAILMDGLKAGHVTPGEFRRTQNWIGRPGSVIDTASYVPPPPEQLWDCLDPLENYLHGSRTIPPLLDIAAVHYQFEAIHPFLD